MVVSIIVGGLLLFIAAFFCGRLTAAGVAYKRGIQSNPPTMIETVAKEPINIKIDDECHIAMTQYSFVDQIQRINAMHGVYTILHDMSSVETYKEKDKDIVVFARLLIGHVWDIVEPHIVGKRRGAKKKFFEKSLSDFDWFTDTVVIEILDYWTLTKKKIELLATGSTPRQMHGVDFSPHSFTLGGNGKLYAVPRYG